MLCRLRWQQWCIQVVDCDHEGNWNRSCKISIFFPGIASSAGCCCRPACISRVFAVLRHLFGLVPSNSKFDVPITLYLGPVSYVFFWQLARSVWPRCILPSFDKAEKCCCIWYNHNKGGASVTVQGLNYLCISSHGHFFSTWSRRTRVIQPSRAKMEYLAVWNNNIQISPFE